MSRKSRTAVELSDAAAEAVRDLNHATQSAKGELTYPGDAYEVVASLKILSQRLPQSFDQISDFLGTLAKTGAVTADYGAPDGHLAEARSALASAAIVAQTLTEFLDRAHSALAPLGYDTTAEA
jgi:ABC-type transporter Mla subunit MlaD